MESVSRGIRPSHWSITHLTPLKLLIKCVHLTHFLRCDASKMLTIPYRLLTCISWSIYINLITCISLGRWIKTVVFKLRHDCCVFLIIRSRFSCTAGEHVIIRMELAVTYSFSNGIGVIYCAKTAWEHMEYVFLTKKWISLILFGILLSPTQWNMHWLCLFLSNLF